MRALLRHLPSLSASDRFADALRVLLGLAGVMLYSHVGGHASMMIPLMLGVIACALAETEEAWRGRLAALLVTLSCFAAAAFAVELLIDHPWPFALALGAGSVALVMLGAASFRYTTIANATLLLAVYAMIGHQAAAGVPLWRDPLLLVAGGAWYGLFSLAWSALFVQHPVRQALARLYAALGDYLACKALFFVPERGLDIDALRLRLAQANARVVEALNDTRRVLLDRLRGRRRPRAALTDALRRYLAAQDVHERAGSTHAPYQALAAAFFHSDVMFRCQRLLTLQAARCRQLAQAMRSAREAPADAAGGAALAALHDSVGHLRASGGDGAYRHALQALLANLETLQRLLDGHAEAAARPGEVILQDPSPGSLAEAWWRIRLQLTPASARFRHALRLGLAMLAGDAVLRLLHPQQGYWILLTTMLVCQPAYGATWKRLLERVAGTVAGLLAGWAMLKLFPSPPLQLALTAAAGVLFFVARYRRYVLATAAITVLVLLAFNQVGNGYVLILPRLVDTLIGGALAALATLLVLPDGRARETRQLLAAALHADAAYLRQIMAQYRDGKHDDLDYRIARRDAHNADAAVSTHLAAALREPGQRRDEGERALRLLALVHALLGHLSALGAHRRALTDDAGHAALQAAAAALADALDGIAATLDDRPSPAIRPDPALPQPDDGADATRQLVAEQLALIARQLPALRELARPAQA